MLAVGITAAIALLTSLLGMELAHALLTERVSLIGTFVGLYPSFNDGVAFSITFPLFLQYGLIFAALALVCVLAYKSPRTFWNSLGFGMIIGGSLGNIIDRLLDGFVTDYFQVGTFPIFNVADSWITVGIAVLFLGYLAERRQK
jgi:signal peptidase II